MTSTPTTEPIIVGLLPLGPEWTTPNPAFVEDGARDVTLEEFHDRAIQVGGIDPDNGRNIFVAWPELQGNDTVVQVARFNQALQETGRWQVPPPPNYKTDWAQFTQVHPEDGAALDDIYVLVGCHEVSSARDRGNKLYLGIIRGVAVAYGDGTRAIAGPFTLGATPTPTPQPGPTVGEIADAVYARILGGLNSNDPTQVGKLVQRLARNGAIEAGAGQTQVPSWLQTPAAFGQAFYASDFVYSRLDETGYHSATNALKDFLAKAAPAPGVTPSSNGS